MILSDIDLRQCLDDKLIIIDPIPADIQIDTTSVDLRIGEPFYIWNPELVKQSGVDVAIRTDDFEFQRLAQNYLREVPKDSEGNYGIQPGTFYLAGTYEKVGIPTTSKLAARVEGKSGLARLGLVVHMTAPTIQAGYGEQIAGVITLEIFNYGPFEIKVTPKESPICQLIIECVKSEPSPRGENRTFTTQEDPMG